MRFEQGREWSDCSTSLSQLTLNKTELFQTHQQTSQCLNPSLDTIALLTMRDIDIIRVYACPPVQLKENAPRGSGIGEERTTMESGRFYNSIRPSAAAQITFAPTLYVTRFLREMREKEGRRRTTTTENLLRISFPFGAPRNCLFTTLQ